MKFVAINVLCCATFLAVFWGWGCLVFGRALPAAWRLGGGLACCAALTTLGFAHGLSMRAAGLGALAGAALGIGRWAFTVGGWRALPRIGTPETIVTFVVAGFVVAPLAVGGLQFALFQGNIYDQFNYLSTAVVRLTENDAVIDAATRADFVRNPLLSVAHIMRGTRPAVVELYATFDAVAPGNLQQCSYGFLASGVLCTFFTTAQWVRLLTGVVLWRAQIVAAALVVGFWGQLQFDLNAWSWNLATPVVATAFGLLLSFVAGPDRPDSSRVRVVALGVCGAALTYLYPEILTFFFPAVAGGVALLLSIRPETRAAARPLVWSLGVAFLVSLPNVPAFLELIISALLFATGTDYTALDWFWQTLTGGPVGGAGHVSIALRWLAGITGLAWLLADPGPRIAATLLAVSVLALGARRLWRSGNADVRVRAATWIALLLGVQIVVCLALGYRWIGAKAASYAATVLLPLALLPATDRRLVGAPLAAWLLIGLQAIFGALRIAGAADPAGIHFRNLPYPAVTDPNLKLARGWSAGTLASALRGSRVVKIDVPDLWLESYATICAQAQRAPFFKGLPVYAYWGFGDINYGRQPERADYDALAYVEYEADTGHAALGFARRDGTVASSREVRVAHIESASPLDTASGRLAWRIDLAPGREAKTRLGIVAPRDGDYVLNLGLLAATSVRDRVRIAIEGATSQDVVVAGHGRDVIQLVRLPIRLRKGTNAIVIVARSIGDEPAEFVAINPLVSAR